MFVTIWIWTQEWSLICEPRHGVDVRDVPPAFQLVVAVDAPDQAAELLVPADRDVDPHARHRLGRCEPYLALGLHGDRIEDLLVDRQLAHLLVPLHRGSIRPR